MRRNGTTCYSTPAGRRSTLGDYVMKMKWLGVAGWLLVCLTRSQAQVFEVSPFFGYRFGGTAQTISEHDTDLQAGCAYGLSLDYAPRGSEMKLELFWSRQDSGVDLDGAGGPGHLDLTVDQIMLGGAYEVGQGRLRETVTVLLGATVFSPESGETDARFGAAIGLGVKYYLLKNLAFRADLRGYCTVVEADTAFISTGGITVARFSGSAIWQGEVAGGLTLSF